MQLPTGIQHDGASGREVYRSALRARPGVQYSRDLHDAGISGEGDAVRVNDPAILQLQVPAAGPDVDRIAEATCAEGRCQRHQAAGQLTCVQRKAAAESA